MQGNPYYWWHCNKDWHFAQTKLRILRCGTNKYWYIVAVMNFWPSLFRFNWQHSFLSLSVVPSMSEQKNNPHLTSVSQRKWMLVTRPPFSWEGGVVTGRDYFTRSIDWAITLITTPYNIRKNSISNEMYWKESHSGTTWSINIYM